MATTKRLVEHKRDIFQGPNSWGDCFAVDRRNPKGETPEITLWVNGHYGTLSPEEASTLCWFLKQAIADQL